MHPEDRALLESLAMNWRQMAAQLEQLGGDDAAAAGAYYTAAADLTEKLRGMA
jgi:hypothetical protein